MNTTIVKIKNTTRYYLEGTQTLHREDGPAVIGKNKQEWWFDGRLHRLDGPAISYTHKKDEEWYKEGVYHREDGPAVIGDDWSEQWWFVNGKLHRIAGPAMISKYRLEWYVDGQLHREDGPAIIDLETYQQSYYLHGQYFTAEQFYHHQTFLPGNAYQLFNVNGQIYQLTPLIDQSTKMVINGDVYYRLGSDEPDYF